MLAGFSSISTQQLAGLGAIMSDCLRNTRSAFPPLYPLTEFQSWTGFIQQFMDMLRTVGTFPIVLWSAGHLYTPRLLTYGKSRPTWMSRGSVAAGSESIVPGHHC